MTTTAETASSTDSGTHSLKPFDISTRSMVGIGNQPAKARPMTSDSVLQLTPHKQRLLEASTAIRGTPPDRIDFLHTVQCQCGIPYKNPGDDVLEWDRKQGNASLAHRGRIGHRPQYRRIQEAGLALWRKTPPGADSPGHRGRPHRQRRWSMSKIP